MKLPRGFLLALALVTIFSDVAAADWTRLQSANFTFIGDAPERDIRRVARQLEQFREVMLRALPPRPGSPPAPAVVIVFANRRSFDPFRPMFQGKPVEVGGFFRGGDLNHIAINNGLGDFAVRTVFHEYSHLLVGSTLGVAPAWVNEGIAELYETFEERNGGKSAVLGMAPTQHVLELRSRAFIPLAELMAVDHAIQCSDGAIVLEIQTSMEVIRLAAKGFVDVDFISYRTETPGRVSCGPVPGLPPVLATYRPAGNASAAGIHGAAVAIELIPDGYVPK